MIAIFGPTGVGKTAVAVALARLLRAAGEDPVAVSADALQVYRGLELLTGAPTSAQLSALDHRLVSFVPVTERFSVAEYAELAHTEIDALLAGGRRPLVVGGTGLYLRAALTELDLLPPPAPGARERWQRELDRLGAPALHARLARSASWAAARIDPNDRQRLVRALELHDAGELRRREDESQLWTDNTRRPTLLVGLTLPRDQLYERVERRVGEIVAAGAAAEVAAAAAAGASQTARKALGFEQLLDGDVGAMRSGTRRFAKRQLTWMRKLAGVHVIDIAGKAPEETAGRIAALAREGQGH